MLHDPRSWMPPHSAECPTLGIFHSSVTPAFPTPEPPWFFCFTIKCKPSSDRLRLSSCHYRAPDLWLLSVLPPRGETCALLSFSLSPSHIRSDTSLPHFSPTCLRREVDAGSFLLNLFLFPLPLPAFVFVCGPPELCIYSGSLQDVRGVTGIEIEARMGCRGAGQHSAFPGMVLSPASPLSQTLQLSVPE